MEFPPPHLSRIDTRAFPFPSREESGVSDNNDQRNNPELGPRV